MLTRRAVAGAAAAALVAKPSIVRAAEPLAVSYVPGNAVHWIQCVALDKGFYKEQGFDATGAVIQNSVQSIQSTIAGQYQIATSQPEPFVTAVERGAADLAAISAPMNHADWLLNGAPGVTKLEDLKGKTVGVSSLRTSEVWLTIQLLEKHGMKKDDVSFIQSGTSPLKVTALLKGSIGGAVLFRPSADLAVTQGLAVLASYADLRAYPPVLYVVDKTWAARGDNGKRASAAIASAHRWMADPGNKAESIAILAKYTRQPDTICNAVYDDYFAKKMYSSDGVIDLKGFDNALADMAEDGQISKPAPPATKYVLDRALGGLSA